MTALETVKQWISTFPNYNILSDFQVDYTDNIPANGGIFPSGITQIKRTEDILGNVTITNQYNFGIYCVFEKALGDDTGAKANENWIEAFQLWVQEQSAKHLVPALGDVPYLETAQASNGVLYEADAEGYGTYMVQLSIQFVKKY